MRKVIVLFLSFLFMQCNDVAPTNPFDPETPASQQATCSLQGVINAPGLQQVNTVIIDLYKDGELAYTTTSVAVSSEVGSYSFQAIEPGEYHIRVDGSKNIQFLSHSFFLTLNPGEDKQHIDIDLIPKSSESSAGILYGTVQLAGEVGTSNPNHQGILINVVGTTYQTISDSSGDFSMSVPPSPASSPYNVHFSYRDYQEQTITGLIVFEGESLAVSTQPIILQANPGTLSSGSTTGKILRQIPSTDGNSDDANTDIWEPAEGALVSLLNTQFTGQVDAQGDFRLSGIPAGLYNLQATLPGYDPIQKLISIQGGEEFVLSEDLHLYISLGNIEGTVILQDGTSPGGTVIIAGDGWATVADEDGDYAFRGIHVGQYQLVAKKDGYLPASSSNLIHVQKDKTAIADDLVLQRQQGDFAFVEGNYSSDTGVTLIVDTNNKSDICITEDESDFEAGSIDTCFANFVLMDQTSFTLSSGDGTKIVYVQYKNNDSTVTQTYSSSIILDTQPPEFSQVIINDGSSYTNSPTGTVVLHLSATDSVSGIKEMVISEDQVFNESYESYKSSKAHTWSDVAAAPTGDGTKNIYVQFRDYAGNTTTVPAHADVILDRVLPSLNHFSVDFAGVVNPQYCNSPLVELNIDSPDAYLIALSNTSSFQVEDYVPYESSRAWFITPGDELKTVYVKLKDQAGNIAGPFSDTITLDTQAPDLGVLKINDGADYTNQITVDLTFWIGGDANSWSLDGINWNSCTLSTCAVSSPGETHTITLSQGEGKNQIQILFRDAAGNVSTPLENSIFYDQTPPAISHIISVIPQTTSIFIDLEESIDTSPASGIAYYDVEVLNSDLTNVVAQTSFPTSQGWLTELSSLKEYNIRAQAVDNAGNASGWSEPVKSLVGLRRTMLDASMVDANESAGDIGSEVHSYRGYILYPLYSDGNYELLSCDTRQDSCSHSGFVGSSRDPSGGAGDIKDTAMTKFANELWFFALRDTGGANVELEALHFNDKTDNISDLNAQGSTDPYWEYVQLGSGGPESDVKSGTLTAASNGKILAVAYFGYYTTYSPTTRHPSLYIHTCNLSDDCTDNANWTGPVSIIPDDQTYYKFLYSPTISLDAGENHLWISYAGNDYNLDTTASCDDAGECYHAVLGCSISGSPGNCTLQTDWNIAQIIPAAGEIFSSKVMEVNGNLWLMGLEAKDSDTNGLYAYTCPVGTDPNTDYCSLATDFSSGTLLNEIQLPAAFIVLALTGPRLAFDWWGGNLHYATIDYFTGEVSYGICNESRTDCTQVTNWEKSIIMDDFTSFAGQANLAVTQGNVNITIGRDNNRVFLFEPYTPAPLQRAFVPDFKEEAVKASWTPMNSNTADGFTINYTENGFFDSISDYEDLIIAPDPNQSNISIPNSETGNFYGTVSTYKDYDTGTVYPYFQSHTGKYHHHDVSLTTHAPKYTSNDNCHAVIYKEEKNVKVKTCRKSSDCSISGNWNTYTIEPARGTDSVYDIGLGIRSNYIYPVYSYSGEPQSLYIERWSINSSCTMVYYATKTLLDGTGTPSPDVYPAYISVEHASNDYVFIAHSRYRMPGDVTGNMRMSTILYAFSASSPTVDTWDYEYYGGDIKSVSDANGDFLFWSPHYNNGSDDVLDIWRCDLSTDCNATTEWDVQYTIDRGTFSSADLTFQDGRLMLTYDDSIAWCNAGSQCDSSDQWNRAKFSAELLEGGAEIQTKIGILGSVNSDLIYVGLGNGGHSMARCKGRCWQADNWIGSFTRKDIATNYTLFLTDTVFGSSGEIDPTTGEATAIFFEASFNAGSSAWTMIQNGFMDYWTP